MTEEEKKEADQKFNQNSNSNDNNQSVKEQEAINKDNKANEDSFKSKIEMLRSRLNNNKSKYSLDLQTSKTNYLLELSRMGKYHKLREIIEMMQPTQVYYNTRSQFLRQNELMFSMKNSYNKPNYTEPRKDLTSSMTFSSNSNNKKSDKLFSERLKESHTLLHETEINFINNLLKARNGIVNMGNKNRFYKNNDSNIDTNQNKRIIRSNECKYASKQFYKDKLSKLSLRLFGNEKKTR